jgi:hypothetical protein
MVIQCHDSTLVFAGIQITRYLYNKCTTAVPDAFLLHGRPDFEIQLLGLRLPAILSDGCRHTLDLVELNKTKQRLKSCGSDNNGEDEVRLTHSTGEGLMGSLHTISKEVI